MCGSCFNCNGSASRSVTASFAFMFNAIRPLLIPIHQPSLIGDNAQQETAREFEQLVERLSSRLGRNAVLRPQLVAEVQPEHSYRFIPCLEAYATHDNGSDDLLVGKQPARPFWLKQSPVRVDVLSTVPAGPPDWLRWQSNEYVIVHAWGPERITTGWWNGPHVRRDYYVVEAESGHRFWLFRDLTDEHWYLHAEFD